MRNSQELVSRSGRRDRLEIVTAIIAITQKPSSISHIMGDANLTYPLLTECLGFMISRRLTEKSEIAGVRKIRSVYQATEKGNRFLELYCELMTFLHGEAFLDNNSDLASAYLLQYCRKKKLTLSSKMREHLK